MSDAVLSLPSPLMPQGPEIPSWFLRQALSRKQMNSKTSHHLLPNLTLLRNTARLPPLEDPLTALCSHPHGFSSQAVPSASHALPFTHTHAYLHTDTRHIHTCMPTCPHIYTPVLTHIHANIYKHMFVHVYTHRDTLIYVLTHIHTCIYTQTCIKTHACSFTLMHTCCHVSSF